MLSSITLHHHLLTLLFLTTGTLAQSSTVVVMPTPVTWQNALANCQDQGYNLYRVPVSPTDPVYAVMEQQPAERFWITRRRGGSCTCLSKNGAGDLLEEAPCEDLMPAFCG
ncbi:hypothetical protein C8A00DRAFT_18925 [Chaetomidium leptoderma]|uniref:C-type lectin domain-containing protein n=1 Tax=Chaetomidium leptoderma TaxID=669021 RepID=A0AAN6VDB7_9PEZI|nr:hypothetical protein C8A00DRAFT_18925 [Chaetomidium leptoderma]